MRMDDEPADDTPPRSRASVGDPPNHLPLDWRDYGDAEQLVEMAALAEPTPDPLELVDAPVPADSPQERPHGRRALPT